MTIHLVDTHCHLVSDKLHKDIENHLLEAKKNHVKTIVDVAYYPDNFHRVLEHASQYPEIFAALGIQPHDASSFSLDALKKAETLIKKNKKCVAVGEIGLDAFYELSPMDQQIECYEAFLDLALKLNKPVIIHMRETFEDIYSRILSRSSQGLTGVIHCFTGTWEQAKKFMDLGFFISISGIVTFKKSKELQEVARQIPYNKLLIETDSPYLAPVPNRGKMNTPSNVYHTAAFLAQLRNESIEELAEYTTRNSYQLFKFEKSDNDEK